MTDKIQGATSAPADEAPETQDTVIDRLAKNYTMLAQGLVNQHYELTRVQLLMDCMISSNPSLKYPDEDEIADIEKKALSDTRSTYTSFFASSEKGVDSV